MYIINLWRGRTVSLPTSSPVIEWLEACGQYSTQLFFNLFDRTLSEQERSRQIDQLTLAEIEYNTIIAMFLEV